MSGNARILLSPGVDGGVAGADGGGDGGGDKDDDGVDKGEREREREKRRVQLLRGFERKGHGTIDNDLSSLFVIPQAAQGWWLVVPLRVILASILSRSNRNRIWVRKHRRTTLNERRS